MTPLELDQLQYIPPVPACPLFDTSSGNFKLEKVWEEYFHDLNKRVAEDPIT